MVHLIKHVKLVLINLDEQSFILLLHLSGSGVLDHCVCHKRNKLLLLSLIVDKLGLILCSACVFELSSHT